MLSKKVFFLICAALCIIQGFTIAPVIWLPTATDTISQLIAVIIFCVLCGLIGLPFVYLLRICRWERAKIIGYIYFAVGLLFYYILDIVVISEGDCNFGFWSSLGVAGYVSFAPMVVLLIFIYLVTIPDNMDNLERDRDIQQGLETAMLNDDSDALWKLIHDFNLGICYVSPPKIREVTKRVWVSDKEDDITIHYKVLNPDYDHSTFSSKYLNQKATIKGRDRGHYEYRTHTETTYSCSNSLNSAWNKNDNICSKIRELNLVSGNGKLAAYDFRYKKPYMITRQMQNLDSEAAITSQYWTGFIKYIENDKGFLKEFPGNEWRVSKSTGSYQFEKGCRENYCIICRLQVYQGRVGTVDLTVRPNRDRDLYRQLEGYKGDIHRDLGFEMTWDPWTYTGDASPCITIRKVLYGDTNESVYKWVRDNTIALKNTFNRYC